MHNENEKPNIFFLFYLSLPFGCRFYLVALLIWCDTEMTFRVLREPDREKRTTVSVSTLSTHYQQLGTKYYYFAQTWKSVYQIYYFNFNPRKAKSKVSCISHPHYSAFAEKSSDHYIYYNGWGDWELMHTSLTDWIFSRKCWETSHRMCIDSRRYELFVVVVVRRR